MIHPKYQKIVFAFFMALIMSCLMSFVITTFNVGLNQQLIHLWLKAWVFAFVVAFPSVMLVAPVAHKLTMQMIKKNWEAKF